MPKYVLALLPGPLYIICRPHASICGCIKQHLLETLFPELTNLRMGFLRSLCHQKPLLRPITASGAAESRTLHQMPSVCAGARK